LKFLNDVPEEYVFCCHDGRHINNLKELQDVLATMTDDAYLSCSNIDNRSLANWVRDIIGDQNLAKDLSDAESRTKAVLAVNHRLLLFESVIQKQRKRVRFRNIVNKN